MNRVWIRLPIDLVAEERRMCDSKFYHSTTNLIFLRFTVHFKIVAAKSLLEFTKVNNYRNINKLRIKYSAKLLDRQGMAGTGTAL